MFNKKIASLLMGTVLVSSMVVGCGSDSSESANDVKGSTTITISGSTSVGPSMEIIAEEYQSVDESVNIEIQQLGSSAGIKNAIDGISEMGMASRDLKDEEAAAGVIDQEIAFDAISVILNNANEVKDLSVDQLRDIYTGKIVNWKEVGGVDAPIVVVSREDGSGTRAAFEEILGFEGELVSDALLGDGSGNIKSTVEGNENAIGYISSSYADESVNQITVDSNELTVDNVKSGQYPISRPFLLVYKEESLTENGKALLDYILSADGQAIMEEEGLISVTK